MIKLAKSVEFVELFIDSPQYTSTTILQPCVIKESDTSYKMWYSGHNGNWRGYYATSTNGTDWVDHQLIINIGAEGTYDTVGVVQPCVIKESDTSYKMWYVGHNGSEWQSIIYTTSTDGISWSNYQRVITIGAEGTYDTTSLHTPCVIKESDTSYKIWYSGYNGSNWRNMYATSTDGISWSNYQMVTDIGAEGTYDTSAAISPYVIKESDTSYKMWYSGSVGSYTRIIYATSTDGISWSNYQLSIDVGSEGTYDTYQLREKTIIKESDTSYKMWYSGYDGGSGWRTLYATSVSGISWSNYQLSMNYGAEGTTTSAFLTKGQDIENCVPFMGHYCANTSWNGQFTDYWFTDIGGPAISAMRNVANSNPMYIKGYVVEFDPEKVKVYQGDLPTTVNYNAETPVTVTASGTFDQSRTAMVFYYRVANTPNVDRPSQMLVRGKVDNTGNTVSFRKQISVANNHYGHYYLFESIDNDFTVHHQVASYTGDTSYEIGVYDWHNSFLLGSYASDFNGTGTDYSCVRGYFWGNSRIGINRQSQSGTYYVSYQTVEFNNTATASGTRYCPKITNYHNLNTTTTYRTFTHRPNHIQPSDGLTIIQAQNPTRAAYVDSSNQGGAWHAVWLTNSGTSFDIQRASSAYYSYPTYFLVDWFGEQVPQYPDMGTNPAPIASGISPVKSVENISANIYEHVEVVRLSKGQDVNNCVVFKSGYTTHTSGYNQQYRNESTVYFRGDELYCERGNEGWDYPMELSVVEFYPDQVKVQQGHFIIDRNATSTTVTIEAVDTAKSFLVFGHFYGAAEDQWGYHMCRGHITNNTTLTFDRGTAHTYPILGSYFVVEDLANNWDVWHYNSGYVAFNTYSPEYGFHASQYNTFMLISSKIDSTVDTPGYATWRTYYHGPIDPLRLERNNNSYNTQVSGQIIKFRDEKRIRAHYSARSLTGTTAEYTYTPHATYSGTGCVTAIPSCLNGTARTNSTTNTDNTPAFWKIKYDDATNTVHTIRNTAGNRSVNTYHTIYTVCWAGAEKTSGDAEYYDTGYFVKSIEKFSYKGTNRRLVFSPQNGQDLNNCIPSVTYSVGEDSGSNPESIPLAPWIYPDIATIHCEAYWTADNGGYDFDMYLIEFDPAQVKVQRGHAWIWNGTSTTTATIEEVDTSKAFIMSYVYASDGVGSYFGSISVAAKINTTTQLHFERGNTNSTQGSIMISWFVVECLQDQWSVSHGEVNNNNSTYYAHVLPAAVPEHGTISFMSYAQEQNVWYPSYSCFRTYPDHDQRGIYQIRASRYATSQEVERMNFSAITFNENLGVYVDHIHYYLDYTAESTTVDLNRDYDINRTVVWTGQAWPIGHTETTDYNRGPQRSFVKAEFQDSRTLKVSRYADGLSARTWNHVYLIEFPLASHRVAGVVREKGNFVSRTLNLHRSDTGALIGQTTSSGTDGTYEFLTTYSGSTYVVCFDDEAGTIYNGLIETDVYPTVISGTWSSEQGWL